MFKRGIKQSIDQESLTDQPLLFNTAKDVALDEPPRGGVLKRDPSISIGTWPTNSAAKPVKSPFMFQNESPETTITEGVTIKGEVTFQNFLKIDGFFEGTLISNGKLHVGPSGTVNSDLNLKAAIIEGCVNGNIVVDEHVELRSTSSVRGDITAKSIKVDQGAHLVGAVTVLSSTEPQEHTQSN